MITRNIIYDDYFKTFQVISLSNKFREKIAEMFALFSDAGYPVPVKRFKNIEEYLDWCEPLENTGIEISNLLDELIRSFGLNSEEGGYKYDFFKLIFLNVTITSIPHMFSNVKNENNIIKGEFKIYDDSQITRDFFLDMYYQVSAISKKNHRFKNRRNRFKPTYKRDSKYYLMYLETIRDLKKGIKYNKQHRKSPYTQMLYHPEYAEFERNNGKIEPDTGKAIISAFNKAYRHINLVD